MITVTVKKAAMKRGIKKPYQLQKELDLNPRVAADLWRGNINGKNLPRLQTLDKLCEAWRCSLDELIKWTPGRRQKKS